MQNPLSLISTWLMAFASRPLIVKLRKHFGKLPNQRTMAEEFGANRIVPALRNGRSVVIDCDGVGLATQAFFHALLDDAIRCNQRWAKRIRIANANEAQIAVFRLAMRYMVKSASSKSVNVLPSSDRKATA